MSAENKAQKAKIIDKLEEDFSKSNVSILTDYRGLTTQQITALRRRLQAANSNYKVVKNTLARFAAQKTGKDDLTDSLKGPIAIAFGYGDITAPAKIISGYINETKVTLNIKGGFLGNRLLTPQDVMTLSTLPSREILLARVLGQMKSPISALLGCLTSPMRGVIGVLNARIKQLEGN